jgi:hypothetical protein
MGLPGCLGALSTCRPCQLEVNVVAKSWAQLDSLDVRYQILVITANLHAPKLSPAHFSMQNTNAVSWQRI